MKEAGWEEQSSPTFDLQCCVPLLVHGYKCNDFLHFFPGDD